MAKISIKKVKISNGLFRWLVNTPDSIRAFDNKEKALNYVKIYKETKGALENDNNSLEQFFKEKRMAGF